MLKNVSLLLIICAFLSFSLEGQIRTPAPSPSATFTQDVGLSKITVEYSRPSAKGRTIFSADGLVPHDAIWRAGANAATKVTFSDDATVNGSELKGGSYAVLVTPRATSWDVHFYTYEGGNFGSYVEKTPAATVNAQVQKLPFNVESFTIAVGNLTSNSAHLEFMWENTYVGLNVEVEVDSKVMANIERVMAGPSGNDYFNAASYLHDSGKDLNLALEYITKATDVPEPRFWQVRRKALILADLGRKADAIAAAKQSMELAKAAGNQDYVRMNKKSITDWSM